MPPVSLPPRAARGQVCTLSIATRRLTDAPACERVPEALDRRRTCRVPRRGGNRRRGCGGGDEGGEGVADEGGEEQEAGGELGVGGVEAGIIEADRAAVLEAEEAGHRRAVPVEKPQPRPAGGGEGTGRVAEEFLHAPVHEARLADLGETVEPEEVRQGLVPAFPRGVRAHRGPRQLALKLPYLAPQLVPILAGQPLEIGIPRIG